MIENTVPPLSSRTLSKFGAVSSVSPGNLGSVRLFMIDAKGGLLHKLQQHVGLAGKLLSHGQIHFEQDFSQRDHIGLQILAVDEISNRKGSRFLTLLLNYFIDRLVFVGKHRKNGTFPGASWEAARIRG